MKRSDNSRTMNRNFWLTILVVIVSFVLMSVIVRGLGFDRMDYTDITHEVEGDILYTNGRTAKNVDPSDWTLSGGDELVMHIALPETAPYPTTSIAFSVYNSVIAASCDGEVIWSYGEDIAARGHQIGNISVNFVIPDSAWGRELTVTVVSREKISSSRRTSFYLMPTEQVSRYPIIGHGTEFIIFMMLMGGGIFSCAAELVFLIFRHKSHRLLPIALFSVLVGTWYFGYNRLWYAVVPNIRFNALAEYYSLNIAPIALLWYLRSVIRKGIFRVVLNILTVFTLIYTLGSLYLAGSGRAALSDTLPGLQILLGVMLLTILIIVAADLRHNADALGGTLVRGIAVAMVFAILQILAIRLQGVSVTSGFLYTVMNIDYAAIGIVLFITAIVANAVERFFKDLREKTEKEELKKLAYVDILTGLYNRSHCVNELKLLGNDRAYTMGFFDADHLKRANDTYGHEEGDALIRAVGTCIQNAFGGMDGFYGRWGGDEFIACFLNPEDVKAFRGRLAAEIEAYNRSGKLRETLSISEGYREHPAGSGETPTQVINEADEAMYRSKMARRAARQG